MHVNVLKIFAQKHFKLIESMVSMASIASIASVASMASIASMALVALQYKSVVSVCLVKTDN